MLDRKSVLEVPMIRINTSINKRIEIFELGESEVCGQRQRSRVVLTTRGEPKEKRHVPNLSRSPSYHLTNVRVE